MIVSWAIANNLVYFEIYSGRSMIVIVFWAVENNLVYLRTTLVYDYDSILVISTVESTLVYLRTILVGSVILIVSWAVENNFVYLTTKSSLNSIIFLTNSVLPDPLGQEIKI